MSSAIDRQTFIPDYRYFRECAGKAKFNSEKAARKHIEVREYHHLRTYQCQFCKQWHLATKETKR